MDEGPFYVLMKIVLILIFYRGCLQNVAGNPVKNDLTFCTDTRENLMDAFDNLQQLQSENSFTQSMYVPADNMNKVDYKSYQDLAQSCRLSSRTDAGFYSVLDKTFNKRHGGSAGYARSTCPWVSVSNYDVDRLPVEIQEAQCVCNQCLERVPRDSNPYRYVSRLGRCKPVMTSLSVLRRHCNTTSGLYEYSADTEKVAVGCTCTRPYFIN